MSLIHTFTDIVAAVEIFKKVLCKKFTADWPTTWENVISGYHRSKVQRFPNFIPFEEIALLAHFFTNSFTWSPGSISGRIRYISLCSEVLIHLFAHFCLNPVITSIYTTWVTVNNSQSTSFFLLINNYPSLFFSKIDLILRIQERFTFLMRFILGVTIDRLCSKWIFVEVVFVTKSSLS